MSKALKTADSRVDSQNVARSLFSISRLENFLTIHPMWALILSLGLFLLLQAALPLSTAVKIGEDEDFELAKAILGIKGSRFYADIWNDQPLLHTAVVTQILKHVSSSILGPRLLTSASVLLLLGAFFLIIRRVHGVGVAMIGTVFLIGSPGFLELGSSAMLEIPALAFGVAGLCSAVCGGGFKSAALSGFCFAVSLQIKLIGVILLPLLLFVLWVRNNSASPLAPGWTAFFRSLIVFGVSFSFGFGLIVSILGYDTFVLQLEQAWSSHFAPTRTYEYGSPNDHPFDWMVLLRNWDTTILALCGLRTLLLRKKILVLPALPLLWLALMFLVFATHRPWWSYYYVHVAIPLCYCAAIGLGRLFWAVSLSAKMFPRLALGIVMCATIIWIAVRVSLQISGIRSGRQIYSDLVLGEMARYKPFVRYMYANEPIYSFHTGIPMVPSLCVVVKKRFWSGELTNARIRDEIVRVHPELILLKNPPQRTSFDAELISSYRLVFEDRSHRLFVDRTIKLVPAR